MEYIRRIVTAAAIRLSVLSGRRLILDIDISGVTHIRIIRYLRPAAYWMDIPSGSTDSLFWRIDIRPAAYSGYPAADLSGSPFVLKNFSPKIFRSVFLKF